MKLPCPQCNSSDTRVTSVDQRRDHVARSCRCLICKHKYITRERVEEAMNKNKGKFKLSDHQVTQIGYNFHELTIEDWSAIYDVAPTTVYKAKQRFLRIADEIYLSSK